MGRPFSGVAALARAAGIGVALTAIPSSITAQERPNGFTIGVIGGFGNDIYLGGDSDQFVLPVLRYESEAFSFGLPDGLRVSLLSREKMVLSAVVAPRLFSLVDVNATELRGIDRDITIDAGLQARFSLTDRTELVARGLVDVSGEHDGQEVTLSFRHNVPVRRMAFNFAAGATWRSGDLSAELYGVYPWEARDDRPRYEPGATTVPFVSVGAVYPLTQNLRFIANLRAEFLPDSVSDSPIIDQNAAVGAQFGLLYSF